MSFELMTFVFKGMFGQRGGAEVPPPPPRLREGVTKLYSLTNACFKRLYYLYLILLSF